MPNVAKTEWPDEAQTRPTERVSMATLSLASRIDRLVATALEKLQCFPDAEALGAVADLLAVRELLGAVLR